MPMIYEFLKTKQSDLPRTLEEGENGKKPDEITSMDIVTAAFHKDEPDKLCHLVVEKFAEILAVEVGNHALKTLPYGGVFLIGGVTMGIKSYILQDPTFLHLIHLT